VADGRGEPEADVEGDGLLVPLGDPDMYAGHVAPPQLGEAGGDQCPPLALPLQAVSHLQVQLSGERTQRAVEWRRCLMEGGDDLAVVRPVVRPEGVPGAQRRPPVNFGPGLERRGVGGRHDVTADAVAVGQDVGQRGVGGGVRPGVQVAQKVVVVVAQRRGPARAIHEPADPVDAGQIGGVEGPHDCVHRSVRVRTSDNVRPGFRCAMTALLSGRG